ncbi:NTP transferase domain-containing protein [Corynebacterium kutscheri]|uniref:NTP transferase domain-containing protein n=1 Tax=Corynebacterium kutscheri TaxID=35755 RepID=UPI0037BE52F7
MVEKKSIGACAMVDQPMKHAIILAGGRSQRMGIDKLSLVNGSTTMLAAVCESARCYADQLWVVGSQRPGLGTDVCFVRENPPFSGPAAGIMAAVRCMPMIGETLILAGDLAHPEEIVHLLATASIPKDKDGVILVDESGWKQFLCAKYSLQSLHNIHSTAINVAVKRLFSSLDFHNIYVSKFLVDDIDIPEKAAAYGFKPEKTGVKFRLALPNFTDGAS